MFSLCIFHERVCIYYSVRLPCTDVHTADTQQCAHLVCIIQKHVRYVFYYRCLSVTGTFRVAAYWLSESVCHFLDFSCFDYSRSVRGKTSYNDFVFILIFLRSFVVFTKKSIYSFLSFYLYKQTRINAPACVCLGEDSMPVQISVCKCINSCQVS